MYVIGGLSTVPGRSQIESRRRIHLLVLLNHLCTAKSSNLTMKAATKLRILEDFISIRCSPQMTRVTATLRSLPSCIDSQHQLQDPPGSQDMDVVVIQVPIGRVRK